MPGSWRIEVRYFPEGAEENLERTTFQAKRLDDDDLSLRVRNLRMEHEFSKLFISVCRSLRIDYNSRL